MHNFVHKYEYELADKVINNNSISHTHTQPTWKITVTLLCVNAKFISTLFTTTPQQPFYDPLSGTTRVSRYQKKHSPTHHPIFISFFHLPQSIASSLFNLRAWQSFCTTSFHVLFGLPLGLEPSISYSIHFFTQSLFAAHAHTIATCFAVVSNQYYIIYS